MIIVRDINGECINIGEWEHDIVPVENPDADLLTYGEVKTMQAEGLNPDYLYADGVLIEEDLHPLPEGASISDEQVDTLPDGGKVVADAYAVRRRAEYPSTQEQLDYIYHNGLDAWKKDIVKPIKDKYPK